MAPRHVTASPQAQNWPRRESSENAAVKKQVADLLVVRNSSDICNFPEACLLQDPMACSLHVASGQPGHERDHVLVHHLGGQHVISAGGDHQRLVVNPGLCQAPPPEGLHIAVPPEPPVEAAASPVLRDIVLELRLVCQHSAVAYDVAPTREVVDEPRLWLAHGR
eukprot:CAMPEP_0177536454 /NCGR_PEP_ID=MMETSP0369-20130122/57180_1 /TAXON_ID=447022 ORGANISM="Scrippsiella hangoei-like, Strain SHHI-4" /NCGR_SAMPLE_ID=MMETSP0369 /ASSEMBLY_ACC=CAM_ASM_000364 /LENGTH=164 /DNA_ID=CAMNT_0019018855 /DNA_START=52 /DNA_END=544 /DNA_ORIENTATION=+